MLLAACSGPGDTPSGPSPDLADAVSASVTGEPGAYTFSVSVRSPDTGCDRYADWWEVVSADGERLIYRRVLGHSHVGEQPFSRSGGPVDVADSDSVVIRAHLAPGGYGGLALDGSVRDGFVARELDSGWAADLADAAPQPDGCAF